MSDWDGGWERAREEKFDQLHDEGELRRPFPTKCNVEGCQLKHCECGYHIHGEGDLCRYCISERRNYKK